MSIEDNFDPSYYAVPGQEEEFMAKRAQWLAGEIGEEDLPEGAVSIDSLGRKLIFGRYEPKIGRDSERGIKRMPADFDAAVSPNFKPTPRKPLPSVRCVGVKRNGDRCNRWAIEGGTVCPSHGGQLPGVKKHAAAIVETARLRIVDLTDDAIDVLEDLTKPGTNDAIRLKAATEILDRAGLKGGIDVTVEVEHKIDTAAIIAERFEQIAQRNKPQVEEEIEDAEIVEDNDEGGVESD